VTAGPARAAAAALRKVLHDQQESLVALLRELVHIESHVTQPDGVIAVAGVLQRELAPCGFSFETVRGGPLPASQAWLTQVMLPDGDYEAIADVVVARRPGIGRNRLLLLGDLDTAYPPQALVGFPFRVTDGRVYGPGVADMKGGLVVLVGALRALAECGLVTPPLTVVLSPDEQAGSLRSRSVIEAEARSASWCLCLECARDGGNLMGSRAHIGVARLDVFGREAHAGSAHGAGVPAILELAHKIQALHALTALDRGVLVTVTLIQGGRRRSVVPGHASCIVDVRTPNAAVWTEVEAAMQQIAARSHVPGASTVMQIYAHRPGVAWTDATDRLIRTAQRAGEAAGTSFGVGRSDAAGSSSFAGAQGVPTLDGMGPSGGDLMTDHEYVETSSLVERALLLALTIHLLSIEEAKP